MKKQTRKESVFTFTNEKLEGKVEDSSSEESFGKIADNIQESIQKSKIPKQT
eukprot:CAMPEP_0170549862 /NCGR_PEP_ID=MMETSP0211-20121228/7985_1 /TAXON_ID=311385 /ORGANISM="Pseudokeronopsis sp., Strain OXSARD2" /LENGTH=51 /DNA_ID=CAMNT_0010856111 /DNA_START=138 /DNA_END=293 /DNA_ORIENTATION=-